MRKLTRDEALEYAKGIKKFRDRIDRAKIDYQYGEISRNKLKKILAETHNEERNYVKDSGIFLYFGRLWKKDEE